MHERRDIYQTPEPEPKKEGDLPRHDTTPAEFRARSVRNTVVFSAVMLVLLGVATWIISLQDKKSKVPVPEEPPAKLPMLTMSTPLIMSNLTPARWSLDQFRDQRNCRGWQEADGVPGWGGGPGWFTELLNGRQ